MQVNFHDVDGRLMKDLEPLFPFFPEHTTSYRLEPKKNADITITNGFGEGEEINEIKSSGSKLVVIQHGRSISYLASVGRGYEQADLICVGGKLEYNFLKKKFPGTNIQITGIPLFDNFLSAPFKKEKYILAPALNNYEYKHTDEELDFYYNQISEITDIPIWYKPHPDHGNDEHDKINYLKNKIVIGDEDRFSIIKSAHAIIAYSSFIIVEASLMNVPIISWPLQKYNYSKWGGFYDIKFDNFGCSLDNIHVTNEQKWLANQYICDGKNTERVVNAIKSLKI